MSYQYNAPLILFINIFRGVMTKSKAYHKAKRTATQSDPAIILQWFDGKERQFEVMAESSYLSSEDPNIENMTEVETIYAN
tara:strand:+ start:355 stop:597 length:243 start_codon:yes stop_codon:yes gene_type:complete